MSAEKLREAARLMRERADAATPDICPEWTRSAIRHVARNVEIECWHEEGDPLVQQFNHDDGCSWNTWDRYRDAPHIASWHPVVALAVADLLDTIAVGLEARGVTAHIKPSERAAFEAATAYLNEATS